VPIVTAPVEPEETEEEKEAREYAEFKAAKAAKAPKKAKKEAAAPEPAAEPTVRATAPAAPAPGRANLTNILAQWDKPEATDD
jgi:peptidoglycan hydrolase CwlO-like protein